jgi:hypothetical protein
VAGLGTEHRYDQDRINAERDAARVAAHADEVHRDRVAREVGVLLGAPTEFLEDRLRRRLAFWTLAEREGVAPPDADVMTDALVALLRASSEDVVRYRTEGVELVTRERAEAEAATKANRRPMREVFDVSARATVVKPLKLDGKAMRFGALIDVGHFYWPPRRLRQMFDNAYLRVHPDDVVELDRAFAFNDVTAPPAVEHPAPVVVVEESREERQKRLARERQARRRAQTKKEANE